MEVRGYDGDAGFRIQSASLMSAVVDTLTNPEVLRERVALWLEKVGWWRASLSAAGEAVKYDVVVELRDESDEAELSVEVWRTNTEVHTRECRSAGKLLSARPWRPDSVVTADAVVSLRTALGLSGAG